ncbi:MAG: carbohydrate binding domain-containing protein, partial [Lentisphaeria bacterium]|nr:carbohydrate binding domain-containing protein [Lentisphaeria bacterium]
MKKTWILTAGLLAALSLAADTELNVNGTLKATKADAKFPDTWIYYPQYTQVDITSEIVRSEKGNQWKLNISDAKKKGMHLPYFCPKLFPVKPGEKYKFTASVQGNAKIQMALYVNDARGIAGNLLAKPVILTGKPEEISAEFTIPAETPRKTPPVNIRFVMNI